MVTSYFTVLFSRLVRCWVTGEENARLTVDELWGDGFPVRLFFDTECVFISSLLFLENIISFCAGFDLWLLVFGAQSPQTRPLKPPFQSPQTRYWCRSIRVCACTASERCPYHTFTLLLLRITAPTHPLSVAAGSLFETQVDGRPRLPDWA